MIAFNLIINSFQTWSFSLKIIVSKHKIVNILEKRLVLAMHIVITEDLTFLSPQSSVQHLASSVSRSNMRKTLQQGGPATTGTDIALWLFELFSTQSLSSTGAPPISCDFFYFFFSLQLPPHQSCKETLPIQPKRLHFGHKRFILYFRLLQSRKPFVFYLGWILNPLFPR